MIPRLKVFILRRLAIIVSITLILARYTLASPGNSSVNHSNARWTFTDQGRMEGPAPVSVVVADNGEVLMTAKQRAEHKKRRPSSWPRVIQTSDQEMIFLNSTGEETAHVEVEGAIAGHHLSRNGRFLAFQVYKGKISPDTAPEKIDVARDDGEKIFSIPVKGADLDYAVSENGVLILLDGPNGVLSIVKQEANNAQTRQDIPISDWHGDSAIEGSGGSIVIDSDRGIRVSAQGDIIAVIRSRLFNGPYEELTLLNSDGEKLFQEKGEFWNYVELANSKPMAAVLSVGAVTARLRLFDAAKKQFVWGISLPIKRGTVRFENDSSIILKQGSSEKRVNATTGDIVVDAPK